MNSTPVLGENEYEQNWIMASQIWIG